MNPFETEVDLHMWSTYLQLQSSRCCRRNNCAFQQWNTSVRFVMYSVVKILAVRSSAMGRLRLDQRVSSLTRADLMHYLRSLLVLNPSAPHW
ncbi:hypothetical protein SCLCIDRAFT_193157 [Scleroderma citrinum Foug A]|uniref:Uncharacterized protein n=1 Tax=Scleroderma citrinum Foug A TaxID=1036808 RepID=A0A0C2ZX05_9AGAM|nr:hypothetical protein SCLCIDRAFT_193157 [Scleroderma citrinum Foug A]